ncbi:hypothetical protein [Stieleria mannarensis]|uniref:hypothetical protein n=1 Tax=Stieleria mannarensis TaxID=2755585 RepID=UPI001601D646|nr:hypothetical protein [Rhodopirellula sp. JC639]
MSQRNRFLIDPKVQWSIIRRMSMHWSLTILALLAIGIGVQLIYAPGNQSFNQAIARSFGAQAPLLCIMVMLYPVYVWDIVKLTHRFAGPMLRLRGILNELADGGRAMKLKFRPNDFWQETATDFNRFYEEHVRLKNRCEELENELKALTNAGETLESAELST